MPSSARLNTCEPKAQHSGKKAPLQDGALVVHPVTLSRSWQYTNAGLAAGAMAPPPAPDEGMPMLVPVGGGLRHGLADLLPGREAPALEGQGAQDFPPRFDQIEIGRVLGLEDELPARIRQTEQQ